MTRLIGSLVVGAGALLAACERQGELAVPQPAPGLTTSPTTATAPASRAPAQPATAEELRAAEQALAAYLDASRDGSRAAQRAPAAARDTLLGCDAGGAFVLPVMLLGAYRTLPASGAGDTLLGRAVVVTVAEQRADRRDPSRFLARQRVETDTLEWDLVRRDDGAGWAVCNGVQFGFHEPAEATTWFPLGTSRATARRLADSLHARWTP